MSAGFHTGSRKVCRVQPRAMHLLQYCFVRCSILKCTKFLVNFKIEILADGIEPFIIASDNGMKAAKKLNF
jgi:hypothetical protein